MKKAIRRLICALVLAGACAGCGRGAAGTGAGHAGPGSMPLPEGYFELIQTQAAQVSAAAPAAEEEPSLAGPSREDADPPASPVSGGQGETDPTTGDTHISRVTDLRTVFLAGGCFWGVQKFFDQFAAVVYTETGYANGPDDAPAYEDVCAGSGHAETVMVVYDAVRMPLARLLEYYFMIIDPLSENRQGNDTGIQYRTGIYYTEEAQLPEILAVYEAEERKAGAQLAVELEPIRNFFAAEEYHQKYLVKNPEGYCHIPVSLFSLAGQEGGDAAAETPEELRARIGDLSYEVTRNGATEQAFSGVYDRFFEKGLYVDVVSGQPLFTSMDKYDSGCGWPAFTKPVSENAVSESADTSHGMLRTEVRSSGADSHLGHVFHDGPRESGGLRYCINSAALRFVPYDELEVQGYAEYKALFQ